MKNVLNHIIILLLIFLLTGCAKENTQINNVTSNYDEVTFDIEYHRGGRNQRPENTLYSYLYAIEDGASTIECDMQLTNDGVIIMSHDPYLSNDKARDANGNYVSSEPILDMRTMSLEEIKTYDVAKLNPDSDYYKEHGTTQIVPDTAEIPTIDEFFSLVKEYGNGININIEMKLFHDFDDEALNSVETDIKEFVSIFYDKVLEYDLKDQIILQSFDWQALVEMEKLDSEIKTSALYCNDRPEYLRVDLYLRAYEDGASPYLAGLDIDDFKGDAIAAAHSLGIDIISPYCDEVTLDMVNEAHGYGMKIVPWTANTKQQMETMYEMGVDGIITDNGPLLREILLAHGETLKEQKEFKDSQYHLD